MPAEPLRLICTHLREHGLTLDEAQLARVTQYAELLAHWNRRINLVGDGDLSSIYTRHMLDGLMLGTLPWPPRVRDVIDIGSGAGLPGILLAVLHPECRVVSVERVAKKISFQQVARERLGLDNFIPLRADVRDLAAGRLPQVPGVALPHAYDLAVARAFARMEQLLALAAALLVPGGTLWAMKGRRLEHEQAEIPPDLRATFAPEAPVLAYDFPEFGLGGRVVAYRAGARNS